MISDRDRRDLYEALDRSLGEHAAATLMELLPPVGWADLARQSDLVGVRGEIAEVRGEIAEVRGDIAAVRGEIVELRGELKEDISHVRNDVADLKATVAGQFPRLVAANMGSSVAVAGLVVAAARFL